jgi:hypothetical protein
VAVGKYPLGAALTARPFAFNGDYTHAPAEREAGLADMRQAPALGFHASWAGLATTNPEVIERHERPLRVGLSRSTEIGQPWL